VDIFFPVSANGADTAFDGYKADDSSCIQVRYCAHFPIHQILEPNTYCVSLSESSESVWGMTPTMTLHRSILAQIMIDLKENVMSAGKS